MKTESESVISPDLTTLQPDRCVSTASGGEALDTAREQDRAWRKNRAAAMQARLEATVRQEAFGQRVRGWSERCMLGGLFATVFAMLGLAVMNGIPALLVPAVLLAVGCIFVMLAGLALSSASRLLGVWSRSRRKRLLRQAARDHVEVQDPST